MKTECLFKGHDPVFQYKLHAVQEDVFKCSRCGKWQVVNKYINCEYWTNHKPVMSISVPDTGIGDLSDGYHTFNELYHHRAVLFSVICNSNKDIAWKSKQHHDGTMFNNMFIAGINTPNGTATYHYDINPYWDMFNVKELDYAPKWDGHTAEEAIIRIGRLWA